MVLYTLTRFFVRASIILFYLRVFPPKEDSRLGRLVLYTMIFNVAYNLSFFLAVVFQCTPISLVWTQWESHHHEGHCSNANILVWMAAVTGIIFDLWLLALPFPQLLALNLHWKKKVMGGMMFFVGVACVCLVNLCHDRRSRLTNAACSGQRHYHQPDPPQNHQRVHPDRQPNQYATEDSPLGTDPRSTN